MLIVLYMFLAIGVFLWFQSKPKKIARVKPPRPAPPPKAYVPPPPPPASTVFVPPTAHEMMTRLQEREEQFLHGILDKYPGRVERHFYVTLAGTSHNNPDRTSRTAAIAKCEGGEELWLEHQPTNKYDPNAIAVYSLSVDRQIGFLPARLAGETVRAAQKGYSHALYFARENLHPENDRVVGATCVYLRLMPLSSESMRGEEMSTNLS